MSIKLDEVVVLFRAILGREISADHAASVVQGGMSFDVFRRALLLSEEGRCIAAEIELSHPVFYRPTTQASPTTSTALAVIVKDGAGTIEQMLRSCLPVVDFVAIYDTGSTDQTLAICERVLRDTPHHIAQGALIDFSHARNTARQMVPASFSWTLMLDADEYLVPADLNRLRWLVESQDVEGWNIPRYNFTDNNLSAVGQYPDFQRRLLRNLPHIHYTGKVHESVAGVRRWAFAPIDLSAQGGTKGGPHIHHTGQLDLEAVARKHALYVELARQ